MNSTLLLGLMIVLLIVLIVLVLIFTASPSKTKKRKVAQAETKVKEKIPSFEEYRAIIKSKSSSAEEIMEAYQGVLKHYGKIKDKLGIRVNPDFDRYMDLIFAITRHKNANAKLVIGFEKELSAKNPKYEREIADAFNRGLSSRV